MNLIIKINTFFFSLLVLGICIFASLSFAQDNKDSTSNISTREIISINSSKKGNIRGTVHDINGNYLFGANVRIQDTNIGDATDIAGNFTLLNLPEGEYIVIASYIGYLSEPATVKVLENNTAFINITLKPYAFMIGGIEVLGNKELLPNNLATQTTITAGEIEHYQALSIKDVLELVPGIQKSGNPDLDIISTVALRSNELNRTSAFGTQIIIDNVPVSNNSNLQFENNYSSSLSNMGGGIDLRTIPADNIELIEVITGLPSVKYGDMTDGVIHIKTKSGKQPYRIKIKSNPGTREGNFSGGSQFNNIALSYNLNAARSERNRRINGDEYTRLTAQSIFSGNYLDGTLNLNFKINGQKTFDDTPPTGDKLKIVKYDKGYSTGFSSWGKLNLINNNSSFEYSAFLHLHKVNSNKERFVIADNRILPNGDTVSNYVGKVETFGKEWNIGGRLEFDKKIISSNTVHNLTFGMEVRYDANTGRGVVFDTLYSYYGPESGVRPYLFDDIPGMLNTTIYAEDKISGKLFFDYTIQFGFRYELYRPNKFNINGIWGDGDILQSHNGSFFNPRISFLISLLKNHQIRFSAGKTSKSPALSTLFPRFKVYDWRNPLDGKNFHLRYDLHVPDLQGIKETQFEVSYDFSLFNLFGISISAYYRERKNENEGDGGETSSGQPIPVFISYLSKNNRQEVVLLGSYNHSENLGWSYMRGIEGKITSVEIKPLHVKFTMVGSYNYFNSSRNGSAFYPNPDPLKGQYPNYKVPIPNTDTLIGLIFAPLTMWKSKLQLNYHLTYTLEKLGLWTTLRAENTPYGKYRTYNRFPEIENISDEKGDTINQPGNEALQYNSSWLFSINITKELFDGAEVSFYVNNLLDDTRYGRLFYGIEFSSILDKLF